MTIPNPLSMALDKAIKPAVRKRGFYEHRIITDWQHIVGEVLASYSSPKKLVFPTGQRSNATLYVEVYDSGLAMELQMMEPLVIEKISTYFGYQAISRIRILQNPAIRKPQAKPTDIDNITLPQEQLTALEAAIGEEITEPELRNALLRLAITRAKRELANISLK